MPVLAIVATQEQASPKCQSECVVSVLWLHLLRLVPSRPATGPAEGARARLDISAMYATRKGCSSRGEGRGWGGSRLRPGYSPLRLRAGPSTIVRNWSRTVFDSSFTRNTQLRVTPASVRRLRPHQHRQAFTGRCSLGKRTRSEISLSPGRARSSERNAGSAVSSVRTERRAPTSAWSISRASPASCLGSRLSISSRLIVCIASQRTKSSVSLASRKRSCSWDRPASSLTGQEKPLKRLGTGSSGTPVNTNDCSFSVMRKTRLPSTLSSEPLSFKGSSLPSRPMRPIFTGRRNGSLDS
eukprot:scaffold2956_cov390-Prasinococcus_capsulatus_cf.AAC.7